MSELQRFVPEDQDTLTGLLYRVGHWMIHVDDTDAEEVSEKIEEEQMLAILTKISKSPKAGPLVCEMAAEALRQKLSWPRWAADDTDALDEVAKACGIIKSQGTRDEFTMFGKAVMMLATGVARAVREDVEHGQEEAGYFSWLSEKANNVVLALTDGEAHKDMNISPAEDTALNELISVLKA